MTDIAEAAALELREAGIHQHGRWRLHPTSARIEQGSITGVIGPNGSGKSTLLAVLALELRPSTGDVLIGGEDAVRLSLPERARKRALLAQETPVAFPFTVRDVVSWGRTPWPRSARDDDIVAQALDAQGLTPLVDRPVTELSGGERKRVHLARVIAQQSPILMLDEADSDLDLLGRRALDDLVQRHAERGGTVLVVSHDVNRLGRLCDHLIVMGSQRVVAHGGLDDVLTDEVLSQAYGCPVQVDARDGRRTVHLP